MNQVQQQAQAAYELLLDKNRWTTGYYAKNVQNDWVEATDVTAVCWCALGTVLKVTHGHGSAELLTALERHFGMNAYQISQMNDHDPNAHEKLLEAFKKIAEGK